MKIIKKIDERYAVIDHLNFDLRVELYNKSTETIPKVKIEAVLP